MTPDAISIRPGRPDDAPALAAIEDAAAGLFADIGIALGATTSDPAVLAIAARQHRLLVATDKDDRPLGFALTTIVDGHAHLAELDVAPAFGRRGIGRGLIAAVAARAAAAGHDRLTLTTFRDVPWNGPFYRRLGFRVIAPDDIGPGLAAIRAAEALRLDPLSPRVAMQRPLDQSRPSSSSTKAGTTRLAGP
ncbi:N-acetyltransferase [Tistrella bauzanensis]|uniref:N-acetyltransferase n=1 Tax=Tistrella bauzanensis TaxID=657419 RepID=A0ABQ1IQZ2_9PROT|nr:GNAT family N-acetyltransferase [Tistrella bauzanensis]GGB50248.1 N-acetyltransferase [Tistrella bauzanensis]